MSDAGLTPLNAYLIAPPEDAPSVASWHTTLAGVGVTCVDTWASSIVSDASTVDAAAVWDWTQDASTLEADWTTALNQIQTAHLVTIVTMSGTTSTVQAEIGQYAIDSGIPLIYCGPVHDFLAVQPVVVAATTLAGCKTYAQAMVASSAIQAALSSPNASLYSVRTAVSQYIQPPVLVDAGAALDAGAVQMAARAPHHGAAADDHANAAGLVAGAVLVAGLLAASIHWGRRPR